MKRFFSLFLVCLTLLTGCAGSPSAGTAEELPPKGSTADSGITLVDEPPWFVTCRIVDGAENDTLVLAEQGDGGTGVYTLSTAALGPEALPEEPLRSGQLINVYYGAFTESWPMEFGCVTSIEILQHFCMDGYFEKICGASTDFSRNSKEAVIAYLLESCGARDNAIMVGDTAYDVIGAKAHGIPTVGVSWGYGLVADMEMAGAIGIANTMDELYEYLSK